MKYGNHYNTVELYVGETTSPQTVKIYTDSSTSVDIQVSGGNKWYSYVLPKDKGLYRIVGDYVKKVVVKADINVGGKGSVIPSSTIEASFKGSNLSKKDTMAAMFIGCASLTSLDVSIFDTSKVTSMGSTFAYCSKLSSLDSSGWDTSNVTSMNYMFSGCNSLKTIRMVGCSLETRTKIQNQLKTNGITGVTIVTK